MTNPEEGEFQPFILNAQTPGKVSANVHHRHGDEVPCIACELVHLQARVKELEQQLAEAQKHPLNRELNSLVSPPFALYEDYEHVLHVIDSTTRVVLTDNYAYDATPKDKLARMVALVAKLNAG